MGSARWPTFLVIGAPRAGTTALHGLLRQHPGVLVPPAKEPNYFTLRATNVDFSTMSDTARAKWHPSIGDADTYQQLFADHHSPRATALGECSPVYLCVPETAGVIREVIPEARLIAILRDPVERALSHHAHNRSLGLEPHGSFEEALGRDDAKGKHAEYVRVGRYAELLEPYRRLFEAGQLLLLDQTELRRDLHATTARVFAHIGVDPAFRCEPIVGVHATRPPEIDSGLRAAIIDRLRDDTRVLIEQFGFEPARAWSTA